MKAIWKYEIDLTIASQASILMPVGKIVHVGNQQPHVLAFWVEVDPNTSVESSRIFQVVATGQVFHGEDLTYLGSTMDNEFVWHLYERKT